MVSVSFHHGFHIFGPVSYTHLDVYKRQAVSRVTLTKYLHELERDGFVQRIEYPAPPLRTEYSLTPMGLSLLPILQELAEWGEQ